MEHDLRGGDYFNSIEKAEKDLIKTSLVKIRENIQFDLSKENDEEFKEAFQRWATNPPNITQIEKVLSHMNTINEKIEMFKKQFNKVAEGIKKQEKDIISEKNKAKSICGKIKKKKDVQEVRENADDLARSLKDIHQKELSWNRKLLNLIQLQEELNSERKRWAEFTIGKRETLESHEEPIQTNA